MGHPHDGCACMALYNFDSSKVDELSISLGEELTIVSGVTKAGPDWYLIVNGKGNEGFVPVCYLKILAPPKPKPPALAPRPAMRLSVALRHAAVGTPQVDNECAGPSSTEGAAAAGGPVIEAKEDTEIGPAQGIAEGSSSDGEIDDVLPDLASRGTSESDLRTQHRSTIYAPAVMEEPKSILSGYLVKQGDTIKSWKRRYFVCDGPVMYYYHDVKRTLCGKFVALGREVGAATAADQKPENSFFLSQRNCRTYWMAAESAAMREKWIQHLITHAHCKRVSDEDIGGGLHGGHAEAADASAACPIGLLEGYLDKKKEGKITGWKSRWVVVHHDEIIYFTDKAARHRGDPPKGGISIRGGLEVSADQNHIRVEPVGDSSREAVLLMRAHSPSEREEWLSLLSTLASCSAHAGPIKTGTLMKAPISRDVGAWKGRWFVFTGTSLTYYTKKASWRRGDPAKGSIDLSSGFSVAPLYVSGEYRFAIKLPSNTVITLRADSVATRADWVSCLDAVEKQMASTESHVYKVALSDIMARYPERAVPVILQRLVDYLHQHAHEVEGVFRRSAEKAAISELAAGLDVDETHPFDTDNVPEENVHILAGTLKLWLREMPEPLLTFAFYDAFMAAGRMRDSSEQLQSLTDLVRALPSANYYCFQCLLELLAHIARHASHNLMTSSNLAVVIAPNILAKDADSIQIMDLPLQTKILAVAIENVDSIFE